VLQYFDTFFRSDPVVDVRQRAFSVLAGCMRIAPPAFVQNLASRLPAPIAAKKNKIDLENTVL
jgi:hypothetical protein